MRYQYTQTRTVEAVQFTGTLTPELKEFLEVPNQMAAIFSCDINHKPFREITYTLTEEVLTITNKGTYSEYTISIPKGSYIIYEGSDFCVVSQSRFESVYSRVGVVE